MSAPTQGQILTLNRFDIPENRQPGTKSACQSLISFITTGGGFPQRGGETQEDRKKEFLRLCEEWHGKRVARRANPDRPGIVRWLVPATLTDVAELTRARDSLPDSYQGATSSVARWKAAVRWDDTGRTVSVSIWRLIRVTEN